MADSAEAKQQMFRKDKVFGPAQSRWLDRFILTVCRSDRERVTMQHVRGILVHLVAPRSVMSKLGGKIPIAGGAFSPPPGAPLSKQELLARVLRLIYEAPAAFPSNPGLLVKLRHLVKHLGANRQDLLDSSVPPDFD